MKHYSNKKNVFAYTSEKASVVIKNIIGMPYIKLNGNRQIMIEGRCVIQEFDASIVALACEKMKIEIIGQNLAIRVLDNGAVVVDGKIISLNFDGDTL